MAAFAIFGAVVVFALGRSLWVAQTAGVDELIGLVGRTTSALQPEGKVFVRGEYWNATADGEVGEGQAVMFHMIEETVPALPMERPRYLMGVGKPADLVAAVARGIDMFDCVLPTRSGRTGQAFTRRGALNMSNARHLEDPRAIDPDCGCATCRGHARAYVHHLFRAGEMLGPVLLTRHNLYYYQELMAALRGAIQAGKLADFTAAFEAEQAEGDLEPI